MTKSSKGPGLFELLDDGLMYLANKGVQAWNWTTGKTKADLANKMLTVAPVLETLGALNTNPFLISTLIPLSFYASHVRQKGNTQMEKIEVDALEKGAASLDVEEYKRKSKEIAPVWLANSALWQVHTSAKGYILHDRSVTDSLLSLGFAVRAGSYYVMRTDYLPPKKNVFSRARDKLTEMLQGINWNPLPQPVPSLAPVSGYHSSLENRVGGENGN